MNRLNKRIFAALIVVTCVAPCWGQTLFETYGASVLGTNEQAWLRVGTDYDQGQVGLFGTYIEDLAAEGTFGGGVYGTYTLIDTDLGMIGFPTTPSGVYLLSSVGVLDGGDIVVAIGAGMYLGPILVEYNWLPSKDLWSSLPNWDSDQSKLLVGVQFKF